MKFSMGKHVSHTMNIQKKMFVLQKERKYQEQEQEQHKRILDHHSTKKEMEEMQRRVMGRNKLAGEESPEAPGGRAGRKNLARSVIFHKTARVNLSTLSKDELNDLRREEREYYNKKTRELIHDRRENPK